MVQNEVQDKFKHVAVPNDSLPDPFSHQNDYYEQFMSHVQWKVSMFKCRIQHLIHDNSLVL